MFRLFKKKYSNEFNLPKRMWLDEHLSKKELKKFKNCFNQISGAEFIEILNEKFIPFIRTFGFKGSKNSYYLRYEPVIITLNIFKDKYGGNCALKLGVHLDYIENHLGQLPVASKFTVPDCYIHESVSMDNGESWYYYGLTKEEGYETVDLMINMFKKRGIPFLEQFHNYPKPFDQITLKDILEPNENFINYGISKDMLEWIHFRVFLAKFNLKTENKDLALKILEKTRHDEYYDERFSQPGRSPLLESLDKLIENYQ